MVVNAARASCQAKIQIFRATTRTCTVLKKGWQIANIWHECCSLFPSGRRFQILNVSLYGSQSIVVTNKMKPICHYFSRGREGLEEGLGSLYNLHPHTQFVHSKTYLAKYLEMCNTDIAYRLWCNTFQLRSLSKRYYLSTRNLEMLQYQEKAQMTASSDKKKWTL